MTEDYRGASVRVRLDDYTIDMLDYLVKTGPQGFGLRRDDYIRESVQIYMESNQP